MTRTAFQSFIAIAPLFICFLLCSCGGGSNSNGTAPPPTQNPAPVIQSISPTVAALNGSGFTLTVTGSNFVQSSTVQWNGSARPTTYVSSAQLTASIPASDIIALGTATVTVQNPTPGGVSSAMALQIDYPLPLITSLNPSASIVGSGALTLSVTGIDFVQGATVYWNGISRVTTYVSSTQMTAAILAADTAASAGTTVHVTVQNPSPSPGISNIATFTLANPAPQITSVSPDSATAGTSLYLTVSGTGFLSGAVVQVGGLTLQTASMTSTSIIAFAPNGATLSKPGTYSVTVLNPAPTTGPSDGLPFSSTAAGLPTQLTVVSIGPNGTPDPAITTAAFPFISNNGRFVTFNNYLRDTCLGAPAGCTPSTIQYTSPPHGGDGINPFIVTGPVTDNGRYVASELAEGANIVSGNLQLSDTCLGASVGCTPSTRTLLPSAYNGGPGVLTTLTSISEDGRYIAYMVGRSYYEPTHNGDYEFDSCTGAAPGCTPSAITINPSTSIGSVPVISSDARYSVYDVQQPASTNLEVVFHDSCIGDTSGTCVSSDTVLSNTSDSCSGSWMSGDGQYVVYACNSYTSGFILQPTCAGQTSCTRSATQVPFGLNSGSFISGSGFKISAGGRFVAFSAAGGIAGDTNSMAFVMDTCTGAPAGCTTRNAPICLTADGAVTNADCSVEGISADGKYILFYSNASNLVSGVPGASYIATNPLY